MSETHAVSYINYDNSRDFYFQFYFPFYQLFYIMDANTWSLSPYAITHPPSYQRVPPGNPQYVSLTDNFRCPVCRGVLREAVQTRCGHRACAQCVRDLLAGNSGGVVTCPVNDETCVVLKEEEVSL